MATADTSQPIIISFSGKVTCTETEILFCTLYSLNLDKILVEVKLKINLKAHKPKMNHVYAENKKSTSRYSGITESTFKRTRIRLMFL